MALTDLVPWSRNRAVATQRSPDERDPFLTLHREMNRMFDDVARGFGLGFASGGGVNGSWPSLEVSETDKTITVLAELPGLDQKDIEVSLHDGVLSLKGEKKSESDGALYSERWHGVFQRSLQLGPDVDPDKVNASFKNGVLTITLDKREDVQTKVKRIPINGT